MCNGIPFAVEKISSRAGLELRTARSVGKKRKLRWFGHVTRSFGLAKTILQGTVQGKAEKVDRRRGGKIILKGGQGWTLLAQQGQLKTGLCGKELL